jgi:hypothetical protein
VDWLSRFFLTIASRPFPISGECLESSRFIIVAIHITLRKVVRCRGFTAFGLTTPLYCALPLRGQIPDVAARPCSRCEEPIEFGSIAAS